MQLTMNYGRENLELNIPDNWDTVLIHKKPMPLLDNTADAFAAALAKPVGCPPISELVRGKQSACILMCDITRPVPNGILLPLLVKNLLAAGLNRKNIRILVATGLHRPNEGEELREVVGDDWVFENITIQNHFARNDEDHVDLGLTSLGTRVLLDKRLVEADLRIVVGLVEPHFMAGYSGGRKLIMPGVAHEKTITYLHNARFMGDLRACNGNLKGNPLHDQQLEIVEMLGGALAVNVVIDEHRRVAFVNFGEIIRSHLLAVEFLRPYVEVEVPHAFQTVLTSAGGYPLDKTYYQTVKGMVAAKDILAPGGELFIVSEISEGMGSQEYVEAQKQLLRLGSEGFFQSIKDTPHAAIDAWQTQKQLEPMRKGKIFLYTSGLGKEERRLTGVQVVEDLQAELARSVSRHKKLAVIPEGPYVMPFVTA
jgi:nickel-dependent lactate racemase